MIKKKEKEYIVIIMVKDTKAIGSRIKKKEEEFIIGIIANSKEIDMKVILKMDYQKEKEFFIIIMVIYIKVNGEMIKKKVKEFFILIMVIEEWVIIIMINQ